MSIKDDWYGISSISAKNRSDGKVKGVVDVAKKAPNAVGQYVEYALRKTHGDLMRLYSGLTVNHDKDLRTKAAVLDSPEPTVRAELVKSAAQ